MDVVGDAIKQLQRLAEHHDRALVAFSGGKDSLSVLDLAMRVWREPSRVIPFFMWTVPGLQVVQQRLNFAKERYGVDVLLTPHWQVSRFLASGMYCFTHDLPELNLAAVHAYVREQTGVQLLLHGGKRSDSGWRRRQMGATLRKDPDIGYPIGSWNKWDVLAYLKARDIPPPGEKFDIDLGTQTLLWLADNHPEDFRRLCGMFPFAESVVWRREWYGIK